MIRLSFAASRGLLGDPKRSYGGPREVLEVVERRRFLVARAVGVRVCNFSQGPGGNPPREQHRSPRKSQEIIGRPRKS